MPTTRRTVITGSAPDPATRRRAHVAGTFGTAGVDEHSVLAPGRAQRHLIPAAAQRFVARRARARTTEVNTAHVAMISQPRVTADVIKHATR